ncbi:MAG TPA: hypothetical protein VK631_11235 [Solirubrobacteraceae bacterium]|nr:hypothetical protein [Solirubrobacteraceae bacterium]
MQRTLAADHGLSGRNVGGSALDTQLEMHDVASFVEVEERLAQAHDVVKPGAASNVAAGH